MILNLDPTRFPGSLSFLWFISDEGPNRVEALGKVVRRLGFRSSQAIDIRAAVETTLNRIGSKKFELHFEVKRIVSFPELQLFELRWRLVVRESPLQLRLYFTLDVPESLVVGLCFREKKILGTSGETLASQQDDLEVASQLALLYWQTSQSN